MSEYNFSKDLEKLSKVKKFNKEQQLDGIQHDPNKMKSTIFKQDYVVIIRKKLYYAISQEDEEQYIRVYQVNNFMNLNTSHNVYGTPGTCSVTIKGAERVICAEQIQEDIQHWQTWQRMLGGWLNINDGDGNNSWTMGESDWALKDSDGLDLKNMLKAREAKYGWKFAEKCDWEPMDEIYIFGKTRNKKLRDENGMYPFKPIFFGYIDQVVKTYNAGPGQGLLIKITASDQLKLLNYSRVANAPAKMPGVIAVGGYDISYNLPKDKWGSFILNDDLYEANGDDKIPYLYTNVFAGKPPYEIITQLALDAGIPKKYLDTRIEKIMKVPFVQQLTGQNIELLVANASSRLQFCKDAAAKLFVEFFCDEEGNIVLKIPSYALGVNRLPLNNMNQNIDKNIYDTLYDPLKDMKNTATNSLTNNTTNLTNTTSINSNSTDYRNRFLNAGKEKIGYPYIWGAAGPNSFDCSGLVSWCLNQIGLDVGRLDVLQFYDNKSKSINKSELKTGDLAFHNPYGDDAHIAICINDNNGLRWLYASSSQKKYFETIPPEAKDEHTLGQVIINDDSYFQGDWHWTNYGNIIDVLIPKITTTTTTNLTNTTNIKFIPPTKVEKVIYPIKNGDTLSIIAFQFFNNKDWWNEIYNDNKETIGNDPNTIKVGQKLIIYQRDINDEAQNNKAKQMRTKDSNDKLAQKLNNDPTKNNTMGSSIKMGKTLAEQTDQLIPEIQPEDIISFTMIDSDREIYNMCEVQLEMNLIDTSQQVSTNPQTVRRISSDLNSIARFGIRPSPGVISTPLINSVAEAEIFGIMLINTSMSKKITGTLNMIEDSAIKIGDPIRFFTYDEHPYKETNLFPTYNGQSVFYVDAIERSINITNVSTMTLTLKAGRMMGQESVFDQMLLLYRYYFDEIPITDFSSEVNMEIITTNPYTIKESDTWAKILFEQYKITAESKNIKLYMTTVQTIIKLNPEQFKDGATSYKSLSNSALVTGTVIKIPIEISNIIPLSNITNIEGFAYNWYGKYVDTAFLNKVLEISKKLQINPDDLMTVMAYESNIDPRSQNTESDPPSYATGLIQFLPSTIIPYGKTITELKAMSAIDQLDYVNRYLNDQITTFGKIYTIQDAYMAVLCPSAIGKPNEYILFSRGTDEYSGNSQLDLNDDGNITKQEATQVIIDYRDAHYKLK